MVNGVCFLPIKTRKALENQGLFVLGCKIVPQYGSPCWETRIKRLRIVLDEVFSTKQGVNRSECIEVMIYDYATGAGDLVSRTVCFSIGLSTHGVAGSKMARTP